MAEPFFKTWGDESGEGLRPGDGVPLEVVATSDDQVILEDPEGVTFTIPASWLTKDLDPTKQFTFSHNAIASAPPGELEKLWKAETVKQLRSREFYDVRDAPMPDVIDDRSTLEIYNAEMAKLGGFGGSDVWSNDLTKAGVPSTTVKDAAYKGNAWAPPVGSQELRNKNLEIPPDDHRFGEWDEEWDPKRKKWVKRKD